MIDFANDPLNFGDLILDPATNDFLEEVDSLSIVLSELKEMFEMPLADDIDYPEIFSKQRRAQNSDEYSDQIARVRDAERIIRMHPAIDKTSIDVSLNTDDRLIISFKLTTGEVANRIIMK